MSTTTRPEIRPIKSKYYLPVALERRAKAIAALEEAASKFDWLLYKGKRYGTVPMLAKHFGTCYGSVARQTRNYGVEKADVSGASLFSVDSYVQAVNAGMAFPKNLKNPTEESK